LKYDVCCSKKKHVQGKEIQEKKCVDGKTNLREKLNSYVGKGLIQEKKKSCIHVACYTLSRDSKLVAVKLSSWHDFFFPQKISSLKKKKKKIEIKKKCDTKTQACRLQTTRIRKQGGVLRALL
jgi:hypothetical protein